MNPNHTTALVDTDKRIFTGWGEVGGEVKNGALLCRTSASYILIL